MTRTAAATIALALLSTAAAHADGNYLSPTEDRVRLSLGLALDSLATSVRLDGAAGTPGTFISGENDLGLAKTKVEPRFELMVRAGARHRVQFDYFSVDRSTTQVLARTAAQGPIAFRNAILLNGDPVQTDFGLRMLGIGYGYSFWRTDKLELAGTFGVNEIDISTQVRVQTQTRHIYQNEDQAGPFPTLGVAATWVASRRFYLDGRAQYFRLAVDHLQGSLGLYELNALYRFRPNVSFALGYREVRAYLNSRQASNSGRFDFSAKGPQLFVRIAF